MLCGDVFRFLYGGAVVNKLANIAVHQAIECNIIIVSLFMQVSTKFVTVAFAIRLRDSHQLHLVGWDAMKVACIEFATVFSETLQAL
jgi:hypothetical protein